MVKSNINWNLILENYPNDIEYAIAYGSGVFKQKNHSTNDLMLDFIFSVKDPLKWHTENLIRNPSHYSGLKYLGPEIITNLQTNYGAGLYYNTNNCIPGLTQRMKYGVIHTETLLKDLNEWNTLYISGRLHKPFLASNHNTNINIIKAVKRNMESALNIALLLLPEKFTEKDLFLKIAGISYLGDFRMRFGENPKKVRNIVNGSISDFQKMYQPLLKDHTNLKYLNQSDIIANMDPLARYDMLLKVPETIKMKMCKYSNALPVIQTNSTTSWLKERKKTFVTKLINHRTKYRLKRAIASTVSYYSRTQSLKGILTAGITKTVIYVAQKLKKTYFK